MPNLLNQAKNSVFLFAHGAGADKDSDWMLALESRLVQAKLPVIRFNFPYMQQRLIDGKRRPPDRQPKLLKAFADEVLKIPLDKKVIIGGKSMGGRMATLLIDQAVKEVVSEHEQPILIKEQLARIVGVVCMGFPFHPPKKQDKYRGEHLRDFVCPTLILQGERDSFGNRLEVSDYPLSAQVKVEWLADGDHSFKPRVKSGSCLADNQDTAAQSIINFINSL
ncbi:alpha/beta family hydrolase [Aliikangiella sp. IMCC44653]